MEIRGYRSGDETDIIFAYQEAFNGFPWFNSLSCQEAGAIWQSQSGLSGFECIVAVESGKVVGATWWDTPTADDLAKERGTELAAFVAGFPAMMAVWLRETLVHPKFHGQGIARTLKEAAFQALSRKQQPLLLLTRMRDDNTAIVKINSSLGMRKTGIRVASQHHPGVMHDYWYVVLNEISQLREGEDE